MPASSYENPESPIVDFFRIKCAGSSNYRGSVFLLPEFTPSVCLLAFLVYPSLSPGVLTRLFCRGVCAYLLWSLSPRTTTLAYNRGPGATFFASGNKKLNSKLVLSEVEWILNKYKKSSIVNRKIGVKTSKII